MKVKSESEVAQSCLILRDPMDCSRPGSSVHGIFQARVLEWGAIAFSYSLWKCKLSPQEIAHIRTLIQLPRQTILITPNAGEDAETLDLLYTAGRRVKLLQQLDSLKTECTLNITVQK